MEDLGIVESYLKRIKEKTSLKEGSNILEITTPFLDNSNDHIQLYLKKSENGGYILMDDGDTLESLRNWGVDLNTQRKKDLFESILKGFGVKCLDDMLYMEVNKENVGQKKHNLIQAILSVNDMRILSRENIVSIFKDEVKLFLNTNDIYPSTDVKIAGKSGLDHNMDLLFNKSKTHPEIIAKVINTVNSNQTKLAMFAFNDIRSSRDEGTEYHLIYNDEENDLTQRMKGAFTEYSVKPFPWSAKKSYIESITHN